MTLRQKGNDSMLVEDLKVMVKTVNGSRSGKYVLRFQKVRFMGGWLRLIGSICFQL